MRNIPKPIEGAVHTYRTCISTVDDLTLKALLSSVEDDILIAATEYESAVADSTLFSLPVQEGVGPVSTEEMKKVYTYRMVGKTMPGRHIYDKLILAPKDGRCPLCGQRQVTTLDHHLPKSSYPALVVTPINLVPSCLDCNIIKRAYIATRSEEETLHPYFDNVEEELWLTAEVLKTSPITVQYRVNQPATWSDLKFERVKTHMRIFKLYSLFVIEAADELAEIEGQIQQLYIVTGGQGVRDHLHEQAISRSKPRLNSWRAALYHALSLSDWYCQERFK